MREFKFRTFSKKENKFNYFNLREIIDSDSAYSMCVDQDECLNGENNLCGCNIQQFTGLKDKNGKEIYEGDIVKWEDTTTDDYKCQEFVKVISLVIFKKGCFYMERIDGEDKLYLYVKKLEVIGNRYENLKLLDGEDKKK
jgi:uncharacterized phage protein (TIGR01671 family)